MVNIQAYMEVNSTLIDETERNINRRDLEKLHGPNSFGYEHSHFTGEIKLALNIGEKDVFYDLGSGYGEVVLKFARLYPATRFIGLEIVRERFLIAKATAAEHGILNVEFRNTNMLEGGFDDGTVFYIFNPLLSSQYSTITDQLERISIDHRIIVIAEADACLHFDQQTWLRKIYSFKHHVYIAAVYESLLHQKIPY